MTTATCTTNLHDYREARRALEFARCHDWGVDAQLRTDPGGNYYLTRLVDCYTIDGEAFAEPAAIPATIAEAKAFGQYCCPA